MMHVNLLVVWAWVAVGGFPAFSEPPPLPKFEDITDQAGIRFKHSYGDRDLSNIVEGTGPGATFFDFDNDGFLDTYFVNGRWLKDLSDNQGRDLRGKLSNALYHNNRDGTFTNVTERSGVGGGTESYGMSSSAGDYDGDGDLDLYVLNYGPNILYRNNGDGTFTDVSAKSGLGDPSWGVSGVWLDYDGDGDLDVYVANYLEYDAGKFRAFYAAAGYPGPLSYKAQPDRLYRNNGDGTFTDVTKEAGLFFPDGRAMSAIASDLNGDGYLDIYVANDATPNCYWIGNGKGTFENQALAYGVAFGEGGQGASSMGPVVGDVDRDGLLDLFIPDMGYSTLLVYRGAMFIDSTAPSGIAVVCGQYTGWGGGLFDYDHDGYLDVFVANGNAHHEYPEEDVLLHNNGHGKFVDVAVQSGAYFKEKYVSRGAAFADFDNDGDIDILVANLNDSPRLLRNDGGNRRNWLMVEAKVPAGPGGKTGGVRTALTARVTVTIGKQQLVQEVCPIIGYLSQGDHRVHFGLGGATHVDQVEIRWPDRQVTKLKKTKANQVVVVVQEKD